MNFRNKTEFLNILVKKEDEVKKALTKLYQGVRATNKFLGLENSPELQDTYYKPIEKFEAKPWKLLFDKNEKISSFITKSDKIIFISEKNNSNAVYSTSLLQPNFKTPILIIPSIKNEVINGLFALKDGFLITSTKDGVESKLYLFKNNKLNSIELPFPSGSVPDR